MSRSPVDVYDVSVALRSHVFTVSSIDCHYCNAFVEADDEHRTAEAAARQGWIERDGKALCPKCKHRRKK